MSENLKRNIAFTAIILGFFMALLDTTIVNIALPEMTEVFGASLERISWVVNGYNLAFAVFLITGSRIADQFGRKRVFLIGLILFTVSSALAGMSGNAEVLIIFRVVQGLSAAILVPVTIPLATDIFPPEKHGLIVGIWGAISGLAAASGPALGGILTHAFAWNAIFYVNIPLGLIALLLSVRFLRESYDPTATRTIDWAGMLWLSIGMFGVTFALIRANDLGWNSFAIIGLFVASAIGFLLFVITEFRVKEPMLPMWLMRFKAFDFAALTMLMAGAGIMAATFLMSFFMMRMLGYSVLGAGLTLSTMPLASMVFSAVGGALASKWGSRWFAAVGLGIMAFSIYLFGDLDAASTRWDVIWRLMVTGVGMGLSFAPVMGSVVRNVPPEKVGIASGVANMTRALGIVLGVAILVTVLNGQATASLQQVQTEIVGMVKQDQALDPRIKTPMLQEIAATKPAANGEPPSADALLERMDQQRQFTLANTPEDDRAKVAAFYDAQDKEISKLIPKFTVAMENGMVSAFRYTFHFGAIFMTLGIVFGLFSDRRRITGTEENRAPAIPAAES